MELLAAFTAAIGLVAIVLAIPFVAFITLPVLAFAPAAAFLWRLAWEWSDLPVRARVMITAAAGGWVTYGLYEHWASVWTAALALPIRVDLFLIAPLLLGGTILALRSTEPPLAAG